MGKKVCAKVLETTSVKFPSHSVSRWRDPWCWSRWMCFSLYIILCLKQNTLVFRSWGSLRFFYVFEWNLFHKCSPRLHLFDKKSKTSNIVKIYSSSVSHDPSEIMLIWWFDA